MKAFIKTFNVLGETTAKVGALITHNPHNKFDVNDMAASLSSAVDNKLCTIPESIRVLQNTAGNLIVTASMKVTKDVIPFEQATEFTSVSSGSNVYMDKSEQIWSLQQSGDNKVFVRSAITDDPEEIQDLLASCSNVSDETAYSRDKEVLSVLDSVSNAAALEIEEANMVAFTNGENVEFGIVVACSFDGQGNQLDEFTILPKDGEAVSVSAAAIVQNFGDVPDELCIEDVTLSSCSSVDKTKLVNYYKRVYGHNAQFFSELEKRIRSYEFCC